ncbi:hypothetical protein [Haloquadratum walsbyi]|jgi:hypothetical protein|uniref:RING-type E3 ubiquitin transferase n=1 Tax=Haloquadratum walsbyi J07HQW2 TaxID=1238425 RepID=U1PUB6_9EURY|nr:hypothetical protein [Haloquadratum walsbyi]ERG95961.1 MAG: hypothetical protein J07HQW2_02422 [Haloquadratum walsbyi J07HQW2]
MGLLGTIVDTFEASTESPNRGKNNQSRGAYWCHDCDERIPTSDTDETTTPNCPECDAEMTLERSPSSTGCAC